MALSQAERGGSEPVWCQLHRWPCKAARACACNSRTTAECPRSKPQQLVCSDRPAQTERGMHRGRRRVRRPRAWEHGNTEGFAPFPRSLFPSHPPYQPGYSTGIPEGAVTLPLHTLSLSFVPARPHTFNLENLSFSQLYRYFVPRTGCMHAHTSLCFIAVSHGARQTSGKVGSLRSTLVESTWFETPYCNVIAPYHSSSNSAIQTSDSRNDKNSRQPICRWSYRLSPSLRQEHRHTELLQFPTVPSHICTDLNLLYTGGACRRNLYS